MRNGFLISGLLLLGMASSAFAENTLPALPESKNCAESCCSQPVCCQPACCKREPCGPEARIWASAEWLVWWTKSANIPALATTGPATGIGAGALGAPGVSVLFGGDLDYGPYSGGRFTAGAWLNDDQTCGIEASYLFLGRQSDGFTAASSGAPGSAVIARPFTDAITGLPNAQLVAFPGALGGTFTADSTSSLQGADINGIANLACCCTRRIDLIGGARWLQLNEELTISENITVLPTINPAFGFPFTPGNTITVVDSFRTRNNFYGGQVGVRGEWWRDRAFVNARGLIALGNTHQSVDINGGTTIRTPAGAVTALPGGLYALPTNIGSYSQNRFTYIPELNVNVGYQVTRSMRAFVGYTFLYWSSVVRPGDQIDTVVNPTRVPTSIPFGAPPVGPARPAFQFNETDFWAQGINLGVEFRY